MELSYKCKYCDNMIIQDIGISEICINGKCGFVFMLQSKSWSKNVYLSNVRYKITSISKSNNTVIHDANNKLIMIADGFIEIFNSNEDFIHFLNYLFKLNNYL